MTDFAAWVDAHRNWRIRLKDYISGASKEKLDASAIEKDNVCQLGKWIYEAKPGMGTEDEFSDLVSLHAEFHRAAASVVRTCDAGKKADAAKMIDSASNFQKLSNQVIAAIQKVAARHKH
jgi:methyl-accepting chemotaxis protein